MTMNRRVVVCHMAMRTHAGFKRVEGGGNGQAPASEMER
jgi:hypothetical protein